MGPILNSWVYLTRVVKLKITNHEKWSKHDLISCKISQNISSSVLIIDHNHIVSYLFDSNESFSHRGSRGFRL